MSKFISNKGGFHLIEMMISVAVLGIIVNTHSLMRTIEQRQSLESYATRVIKVDVASKMDRFIASQDAVANTFQGNFVDFQAGSEVPLKNSDGANFELIDASNQDLRAVATIEKVMSYSDSGLIIPYVKNDADQRQWNPLEILLPTAYAITPPVNMSGMYVLDLIVKFVRTANSRLSKVWDSKYLRVSETITIGVAPNGSIAEAHNASALVQKRNSCRAQGKTLRFASTGQLNCAIPQDMCAPQGLPERACADTSNNLRVVCSNQPQAVACPAMGLVNPGACTVDADCPIGATEFEDGACISGACVIAHQGCGNGVIEGLEECDEGSLANGSAGGTCGDDCIRIATTATAVCGNGLKEAGEECDSSDSDVCNQATCTSIIAEDAQI